MDEHTGRTNRRREDALREELRRELGTVSALVQEQRALLEEQGDKLQAAEATVARRLHPWRLGAIIAGAGGVGGFLTLMAALFGLFGIRTTGPGLDIQVLGKRVDEHDTTLVALSDTLQQSLELVHGRIDSMGNLVAGFVAGSCQDAAQVDRLRRALVPCARLLRERGIIP